MHVRIHLSHLNSLSNGLGPPPRRTRLPSLLHKPIKQSELVYIPIKSVYPFPMWDCHFSFLFTLKHSHIRTLNQQISSFVFLSFLNEFISMNIYPLNSSIPLIPNTYPVNISSEQTIVVLCHAWRRIFGIIIHVIFTMITTYNDNYRLPCFLNCKVGIHEPVFSLFFVMDIAIKLFMFKY